MSEKRRNRLVAPKLHKLVVVARSLRESKPPQANGWWDEEKLVQEEKERAGAILTATRQLRTPRLMMMLSIMTLTSVKALGTKRIQSCPYPFLPHKSPPPCDLPVTVETFPSQPQTRSVYREPLQ